MPNRTFPRQAVAVLALAVLSGATVAQAQTAPPTAQQTAHQAPTAAETGEPMVDSPFFKLSWPKLEMPKFSWKPGLGGDQPEAAKPTGENPISKSLDKMAAGARRASDSVRGAWGAAMDKLSGAAAPAPQTAQAERPGFWSRMFGGSEEPEGPLTVQEFLAQDRVGTTTR